MCIIFARHLILHPNRVINKERESINKNRVYSNSKNAQSTENFSFFFFSSRSIMYITSDEMRNRH